MELIVIRMVVITVIIVIIVIRIMIISMCGTAATQMTTPHTLGMRHDAERRQQQSETN